MNSWARAATGVVAAGAATAAYAAGIERRHWTLREATLPVLPPGTRDITVLHLSDLHMTPGQRSKQRWVAALAELEPDLVVDTGDNLAHTRAVPGVLAALDPLLSLPGALRVGQQRLLRPDVQEPRPVPAPRLAEARERRRPCRGADLRAALIERGWQDATHTRLTIDVAGVTIAVAGVDDPHIRHDRYDLVAGPPDADATLKLGLTHSPEPRVLDAFAADGYDLVLAGHTHGGQLRLPGYGAIVTNCGLDRSRARGASRWGSHMRLHVSAGLGTSPFAPARFCCPPEASLLTLVARPADPVSVADTRAEAAADVG